MIGPMSMMRSSFFRVLVATQGCARGDGGGSGNDGPGLSKHFHGEEAAARVVGVPAALVGAAGRCSMPCEVGRRATAPALRWTVRRKVQ